MSLFQLAIPVVLRREGGYINNPSDPGGATDFGISLRWLKSQGLFGDVNGDLVVDIKDIQALTVDKAEEFYKVQWWDKYGFERVDVQAIATKLFDTAVNLGTPKAVRIAQEAAGAVADGILGPDSLRKLNSQPALPLLRQMQSLQANYYQSLANANPKLDVFLKGWLNRAYDRV